MEKVVTFLKFLVSEGRMLLFVLLNYRSVFQASEELARLGADYDFIFEELMFAQKRNREMVAEIQERTATQISSAQKDLQAASLNVKTLLKKPTKKKAKK